MKDFIKFLSVRTAVYETLAFPYYKEASDEYLKKLQNMLPVFSSFLEIKKNKNLAEGIGHLEEFFTHIDGDTVETLATEFARLFLIKNFNQNIGGIVLCESVYLSSKGLIMQEQRDQVLEAYYNDGMGKSLAFKESEDHLSAELTFIAKLSSAASESLSSGDDADAEKRIENSLAFMRDHLYKWLPAAVNDITSMTVSGYFKGLALVTLGITEIDMENLKEL